MKLTLLSLGSQVKELRKKSGMTQAKLANSAGVSREWLSSVENGKIKVEFGLLSDVFLALGYEIELRKVNARNQHAPSMNEIEKESANG